MHDLFVKMQDPDHCLHQLLPPVRSTTNSLRERRHNFKLYEYNYTFFRQSFVVNCLLKFFYSSLYTSFSCGVLSYDVCFYSLCFL